MDFPAIPIFASIGRVYALAIFYGNLLFRLSVLPFGVLFIWTVAFDIVTLAASSEGEQTTPLVAMVLSYGGELIAELLILNFLAIRVFRLLLLEHQREDSLFDGSAIALLPRYAVYWLSIAAVNLVFIGAGIFSVNYLSGFIGLPAIIAAVPFVLAALVLYAWASFILPAASIPVDYHFRDSRLATTGALVAIAVVTVVATAPWFLISTFVPMLTGADQGPLMPMYWVTLPILTALHCIRTIFFVLANAVCFEERTGWAPDAEKVEL